MRYALDAWRGALGERTRAYLRIAPGQWRDAVTLTPVAEAQVRARARAARTLILQGDTTWVGALSEVAAGGILLVVPPPPPAAPRAGELPAREEWFVLRAPTSPVSTLLAGTPWDSLPPLTVGRAPAVAPGGGAVLEVALGRRGNGQPVATWRAEGRRRIAVVGGRGFSGWAVRGGAARDAHDAFWGGLAGWVGDAPVRDAARRVPVGLLRADAPITWAVPAGVRADTLVVREAARADDARTERRLPITVDSAAGTARVGALAEGRYVAWIDRVAGAPALALVVNASAELFPVRASIGTRTAVATARAATPIGVSRFGWVFAAAVALLCVEWLVRRQAGLR